MLKAFIHHAYRILTFRHNGQGMPVEWPGVLFLTIIYFASAALRFGHDSDILVADMVVWASYFAFLPTRIAGMYLLSSAVIDIASVLSPVQPPSIVWAIMELSMMFTCTLRYLIANKEKGRQ